MLAFNDHRSLEHAWADSFTNSQNRDRHAVETA
jgi:hypothetical protein